MLGLPVESPERIWSEKMLQLTADEVHSLAVRCRIQQVIKCDDRHHESQFPPEFKLEYIVNTRLRAILNSLFLKALLLIMMN